MGNSTILVRRTFCQPKREDEAGYIGSADKIPVTFEDFPALSIPNTTHLLEGKFGDMKRLLKCHHGLKKANKILFINDYFAKK